MQSSRAARPRLAASLCVAVLHRRGPTSLGTCHDPQNEEAGGPECEPWTAGYLVSVLGVGVIRKSVTNAMAGVWGRWTARVVPRKTME